MAVYSNNIYVIGGANGLDSWIGTAEKYDPDSNVWTKLGCVTCEPHSFPTVGVITDWMFT